jgi:MFS family permease
VNFALIFFFGSFMFVLTLLLQLGLGQSPLQAGLETGPLAATFTLMSILGPRISARVGPRSVTIGGVLDILGTIGLIITGLRYGGHMTAWDLAPATAVIGLGQGLAMPSLIGAALSGVPAARAGAAAGILTTMQQFGTAAGIAVIGVVFYSRFGPTRADSVSAMVLAAAVDVGIVTLATGLSLLLPRRSVARRAATGGEPATELASQAVH